MKADMKKGAVKKKSAAVETDAPALMAELTAEFVSEKNLNARAKIRARMKAVLDFCSVDTAYPDINTGNTQGQPGQYPLAFGNNPGYDNYALPQLQRGSVLPIPGADNTI